MSTVTGTSQPPVQRFEYSTGDRDEAHAFLQRTYLGYKVLADADGEDFAIRISGTSAGGMGVDRVRYTSRSEVAGDTFVRASFVQLLGGRLHARSGRLEHGWKAGAWGTFLSDTPLTIVWENIEAVVVSLPWDVLERAAAAGNGNNNGNEKRALAFSGWAPISPDRYRLWDSTVAYTRGLLDAPDGTMAEPLIRVHALDMLAAAALATFPNTTMDGVHQPGPGHAGPATLRRAIDYIEAHAEEPITITDITRAAGGTPRAIQYAFSRHLDTTPTLYLRDVRLRHAHQDLVTAVPHKGVTVKTIAAHWGFAKAGHFSVLYRQAYGQHPSQTLRDAGFPVEGGSAGED